MRILLKKVSSIREFVEAISIQATFISITILILIISIHIPVFAQQNASDSTQIQQITYEGKIEQVSEEKEIEVMGRKQLYQKLEVIVTRGEFVGKTITIENGDLPIINLQKYKVGDEVKFVKGEDFEQKEFYYITDYVRRNTLFQLFMIFVLFVVAIARWRGMTSLIGMFFSFFIIIKFILPQILEGKDPVTITILGSIAIIPVTFFLSHGFNRKTTAAILGTVIAMIITGLLTVIFVNATKLFGFASEEAGFLQVNMQGNLDIRGLLYAGILIGVLGVMDDITISQSAIVEQLRKVSEKLSLFEIYSRAMSVGQDHIASMVNTLVLVYTGAALPLLLLFITNTSTSLIDIVDYEIVAEEVVRTLVGSIGLILAVPITTLIAVMLFGKKIPSRI